MRTIPTLTGKKAKEFNKMAEYNYKFKKGTVDFSKQFKDMEEILKNSKLNQNQ